MAEPPEDWKRLLGRKVSIRYALTGDPEHPFSEAIGVVMSVDEHEGAERVRIVNKRGEVVAVRSSDILAAKVF